jgi:acetolactate synthase I/III small subunit
VTETLVLTAVLEDDLLALNRAIGIVRRRQPVTEAIQLGPAGRPGLLRLTLVVTAERGAAERLANQLRKMVGIRLATVVPADDQAVRECALIRVRSAHGRPAGLYDVLDLYGAAVIEETADGLVAEVVTSPSAVTALIRGLEGFGPCDVTRSGPLVLPAPDAESVPAARPPAAPLRAAAMPV